MDVKLSMQYGTYLLASHGEPQCIEREFLPQRYWYNPETNRVVLSDIPPSFTSIPLLTNYDSNIHLDLEGLREEYIQQQKDAYNPNYRRDTGTYNTSKIREERQNFFQRQTPERSLEQLHHNVRKQNNNEDPRGNIKRGNNSSRRPGWLPIVTPDTFTYTTVIATNYASQGLLHSLIRHGHQFNDNGLSRDLLHILPQNMKSIVRNLRDINSQEMNNAFTLQMFGMEDGSYNDVDSIQMEAHRLIQRFVQQSTYLGEVINTNGQQQVYWKVNTQTVMVLALSEQILHGQAEYDTNGRRRPIRKIITVFFTSIGDIENKRKNNWPVTQRQS